MLKSYCAHCGDETDMVYREKALMKETPMCRPCWNRFRRVHFAIERVSSLAMYQ